VSAGGDDPLEPGATFGRYVVARPLGSGGMATVYEARHVDLHKPMALKVLHPWLALRLEVVQRFVLEARAASRLSHPNVVSIIDIGAVQGVPFLAMELLEGELLAAALERHGPFGVERLADMLLPVISAVVAAHEAGVLHRDLKPDNIFLARRRPHGEHPVLLDFGISKLAEGGPAQPLTDAGEVLGTPPYMSPEQVLRGMSCFDARSDQYALGVVLYECATGRLPFRDRPSVNELMTDIAKGGAPAPSTLRPGIPAAFDAIVARAMSLAPEDRFASVLDLGRALLPFAGARVRAFWAEAFGTPGPRSERHAPPVILKPRELGALPIFSGVPEAELGRLPTLAPAHRFAAGSALFDQGARAASCFVIASGEVELFRTHGADTWKIETVGAGATLGLSALWDSALRPVSAVASRECVVVELKASALGRLGTECPALADRLHAEAAAAVVRRVRGARERVSELLDRSGTAPGREALVRLVAGIGEWSVPLPRRGR
jgi:CRP-like cAMP-binding protein/tRNA A-37 threonylcarbamoyl transferase component Bud32